MTIAEKLQKIADNEQKVYNAGYEKGKAEGGGDNYYDTFWDTNQQNGARTHYAHGFNGEFLILTPQLFRPKYSFYVTNSENMFRLMFSNEENATVDLVELFETLGIVLDTSNSANVNYMFYKAKITRVGTIDCRKSKRASYIFGDAYVETVEKLIVDENVTFDYAFNTYWLKKIRFEGVIGKNISFAICNSLTRDSIIDVVNHLSDDTIGLTITLSKRAVNKAFETGEGKNNGSTSTEWDNLIKGKPKWTISLN